MSYTDACLRCTAPNASSTNAPPSSSPPVRNSRQRANSQSLVVVLARLARVEPDVLEQQQLAVLEVLRRGCARSRRPCRAANSTGRPSSCASRSATGPSVYFGSGAPFGRPRCAATITRAPWSSSLVSTGRDARTRPSSVTLPVLERDVEVGADEHPPALDPVLDQLVERPHRRLYRRPADELTVEVDEPVRVTPLVVVPADDLDLVADHLGQPGVEDARRRVGDDVAS